MPNRMANVKMISTLWMFFIRGRSSQKRFLRLSIDKNTTCMIKNILPVLLFINVCAWSQINYQNNGGSITILPSSSILPITKITPFVLEESEDPCGNPDLDLTTFRSLPWFGNKSITTVPVKRGATNLAENVPNHLSFWVTFRGRWY